MTINIGGVEYCEKDIPVGLAKTAIQVQDAYNLSGVLFSLSHAMETLCKHHRNTGSDWKNHHPLMVLFLAQYAWLCTSDTINIDAWHKSNDLCRHVRRHGPGRKRSPERMKPKTIFLKGNKFKYEPGDAVAWTTIFGGVMCGSVAVKLYDGYDVRRVDGGLCSVPQHQLRAATLDEWDECIKGFIKNGVARGNPLDVAQD